MFFGDLFVTRPCNQELLRVHLFFLSMCWIMFPCCLRMLLSSFTARRSVHVQFTQAALKFKCLPSLPVHLSMVTRTHGSDDNCTSPKLVGNSSLVTVLEVNPARFFFLTAVATSVFHLLSLRSRVNLQQKSPRCCFVKTVCSLDTDASEQFSTVCSRSLPKIDVKPPLAGTRLLFCLQRQALCLLCTVQAPGP